MNIQKEFTVNRTNLYLIIILFMGLSFKAHSRFMLEPHIDYISGKFSIVSGPDGSMSGTSTGLRVGYLGQYFMIGINFEKGHYEYGSKVTSYDNKYFNGGGVGTYLGFHFLDHFRIWTGYLNSVLESTGQDNYRYFGQQVTMGLGYRLTDGWMINYSYLNNYFTQYEDDVTGKTGSLTRDIRVVGNSLSLSFISAY